MTRLICALFALSVGMASAQTLTYAAPTEQQTTLTYSNVMWAAFLLDPATDPVERAHDYLRELEPQRHASNMHDEEALNTEAQLVQQEIQDHLDKMDKRLRFSLNVNAVTREIDGTSARVSSVLDLGIYDLETRFGINTRYFPPRYELLLANAAHFYTFQLPRGVATEYAALIRDVGPQTTYLRVEMELVSLHQGHAFQVMLRNAKWYRDAERTQLLAEKSDDRPAAAVIKERMLSEGITFDAPPEHAYVVADERIAETLIENYPRPQRTCAEQPRENGHRVFLCKIDRPFFGLIPSRAEYRYVGGRLAEVNIFNLGEALTEAQRDNIWHTARYTHMGPMQPHKDEPTEWAFGRASFYYDPAPTFNAADPRPYYRATALRYLDLKAGKPGNEVNP